MDLQKILDQRILLLDGAMGTMIQSYNLKEENYRGNRFSNYKSDLKGNNDLLSLTQAQIIREIHSKYLEAGSDIIETNTFNANWKFCGAAGLFMPCSHDGSGGVADN